ncbi:MAG TPA: glutathione S-transferase family protein [Stellaceae bacterium]|nr:glutathione S-transferase family protein [Stellaceae bacterium]
MALTIYGSPMSRTFRVLWMARELGLQYENIPLDPRTGDTRKPDYLKINPNGHVPAIVDGDYALWESLAINLYLAKKHGGPLAPASLAEEGRALAWSMWALTELEDNIVTLVQSVLMPPERKPEPAKVDRAKEALAAPLHVLDANLAQSQYLLGGRFTVADLNVAGVVAGLGIAKFDLGAWPKAKAWLGACTGREACASLRNP